MTLHQVCGKNILGYSYSFRALLVLHEAEFLKLYLLSESKYPFKYVSCLFMFYICSFCDRFNAISHFFFRN